MPDDFGTRTPGKIWQWLIRMCHKPEGPYVSRLLAPLVRKAVVQWQAMLPVDVVVDGMNLRCRFVDNYSEKKFVFTPWRYDRQERALLSRELYGGGVFVDIGANVGLYTLTAAKAMAGSGGRIIAFEPNPETLARLCFNLRANDLDPQSHPAIHVLNIGIADQETTFTLEVDDANLGASSIAGRNRMKAGSLKKNRKQVEILCRPLLDVLNELSIDRIDALKIDIEGAEDLALMPFLAHAPESLLPVVLFVENSEHLWRQDLFGQIRRRGYRCLIENRMNSVFSLR